MNFRKNNNNNNNYNGEQNNLALTNQKLELQLLQMSSQFYNAQKDSNYHSGEFNKLKSSVDALCKGLLSNNYNTSQLGGNNILRDMTIFDLIEFSKSDFLSQKKQYMETIRVLKEQNDFYKQRIQDLQENLNNALLSSAGMADKGSIPVEEIVDNTYTAPVIFQRNQNSIPNSAKTYNPPPQTFPTQTNYPQPQPQPQQTHGFPNSFQNNNIQNTASVSTPSQPLTSPPKTHVINSIEMIINTLSNLDWVVIEAIGTQGFSESTDILNWIYQEYPDYNKKRSVLLQSISNLNKSQVLESQDTSTGIRRSLKVYKLTNSGVEIYKTKFNNMPVEAECDKIARDHDNIKHGYTIKDTFNQFKINFPIKNIQMDRQDVSVKLPNGETYIPDIVVTLDDSKTYYVEVELGNTESSPEKESNDFNKKCDKMLQVTKIFVIISDTAEVKKRNEQKISTWIVKKGGKDKLGGLTIYSATVTDLSKGDLGKPYIKL